MKNERYTVQQFNKQFPDDAACLDYIFSQQHPDGGFCKSCGRSGTFYRVTTRKCYSCSYCGHQISPTEGTIFHKSSTKLKTWFYAMFLMTASKNGVSAKELERLTGVTYKTAWRMAHQIRKLMNQGEGMLSGIVEADATYVGGLSKNMHAAKRKEKILSTGGKGKAVVHGVAERNGDVRAHVVPVANLEMVTLHTSDFVKRGSLICTDEHWAYNALPSLGLDHERVAHSKGEYVRASIHTNSIEGFWSQLKRSINGTFHQVSREHLQAYVDEFAFRYNHRVAVTEAPIFPVLVEKVGERRN